MEDALRHRLYLSLLALLPLTTSCSWYRDLERSLVEDDERQAKKAKVVSREQYDQLLVKYEELSKKYEALKEGKPAPSESLVDELQRSQGENFANTSPNVETVDVFAGNQGSQGAVAPANVSGDLDSQLSLYRRGLALKTSNPGEATKAFQQLENQGAPAVKVRAKFQIGEMLIQKQQYDLALQVFEDIITKHAHSGVVIDALKSAIVCADKLGITNKKDQYASMLNDVFEAN